MDENPNLDNAPENTTPETPAADTPTPENTPTPETKPAPEDTPAPEAGPEPTPETPTEPAAEPEPEPAPTTEAPTDMPAAEPAEPQSTPEPAAAPIIPISEVEPTLPEATKQQKKNKTTLIVLIVVLVLAMIGMAVALVIMNNSKSKSTNKQTTSVEEQKPSKPQTTTTTTTADKSNSVSCLGYKFPSTSGYDYDCRDGQLLISSDNINVGVTVRDFPYSSTTTTEFIELLTDEIVADQASVDEYGKWTASNGTELVAIQFTKQGASGYLFTTKANSNNRVFLGIVANSNSRAKTDDLDTAAKLIYGAEAQKEISTNSEDKPVELKLNDFGWKNLDDIIFVAL